MDEVQAARVLARYAPELTPAERAELLEEQAVRVWEGGAEVLYLDPYAAAAAHIMSPATVKARTEGSVSETYIDPAQVVAYLTEQSALLRSSWALDAPASFPDLSLDVQGWG